MSISYLVRGSFPSVVQTNVSRTCS